MIKVSEISFMAANCLWQIQDSLTKSDSGDFSSPFPILAVPKGNENSEEMDLGHWDN
jgi:hypothetical protein